MLVSSLKNTFKANAIHNKVMINNNIKNKKEISKTKLSYKLSIIFRACLIPDIILLAEKEPLALINYIEEAYEGLA